MAEHDFTYGVIGALLVAVTLFVFSLGAAFAAGVYGHLLWSYLLTGWNLL